jgi:prevent-host-death family protein
MEPRSVPASEVHRHFAEHLDAVLRGETIDITRSGRPAGRLVPPALEENDDDDD